MAEDAGVNDASPDVLRFRAAVERKANTLPRFVVASSTLLAPWELDGTTIVEVSIGGASLGRRSLKRWPERDGWFFDLTEEQCARMGVDTGDDLAIELRLASTDVPQELRRLVERDAAAARAWGSFSESRRRMLAEHVRAGKRAETRRRRARRALGVAE